MIIIQTYKKLFLLLIVSLCFFSSSALSDEVDDMLLEITSEMNSTLPMQVDSITTWESSIYLEGENLFTYIYTINNKDRGTDYDSSVLKAFFNTVETKFCTDPDTRFLLGITDISMKYFNSNGEYLFKNEFNENDC